VSRRARLWFLLPLLAAASATCAVLAAGDPTSLSLSVQPTFLVIPGKSHGNLTVQNTGQTPVTIAVRLADYAFTAGGHLVLNPRLRPGHSAIDWVAVTPRHLVLAPGGTGRLEIGATPSRAATPGDYHVMVLLAGGGLVAPTGQVAVRTQIGVNTIVRVGGKLRRALLVHRLRLHRGSRKSVFRLGVSNRGNVIERLLSGQVSVDLRKGRRLMARLVSGGRDVLPGESVMFAIPYYGPSLGVVTATAHVRPLPARLSGPGVTSSLKPATRRLTVRL
jgi:hypothetical protein